MTSHYQTQIPGMPLEPKKPNKGCKDVFHGYMTRAVVRDPETDMPIMARESNVPKGVVSFSEAMDKKNQAFDCYVHFYEHDKSIERFWNSPWKYMKKLSMYAGFIAPDYSVTPDMPKPLREYNTYRNQLIGAWLQTLGYRAICNVRCLLSGDKFSLAGAPKNSLIAIGAVGCIKDRASRNRFEGGLIRLVDELEPTGLVVVGEDAYDVFEHPKEKGIPIHFYQGQTQDRFEELHRER